MGWPLLFPSWLYLALSSLLNPSEFDDFMQCPSFATLCTPYCESTKEHSCRYGLLLDVLSTLCSTPPLAWKDRTPVAWRQAPASAASSCAGATDPQLNPSCSGTDGGAAAFGSGSCCPGRNAAKSSKSSRAAAKAAVGAVAKEHVTALQLLLQQCTEGREEGKRAKHLAGRAL